MLRPDLGPTNGNLAEQSQEPSIMGAYEGAAITVVAKGVNIPAGSSDVFASGAEAVIGGAEAVIERYEIEPTPRFPGPT